MSFSQEIKTEIANVKIPQDKKILQIEVLGYILSNVKDFNSNMHFQNENRNVIVRYTYILKNVLDFVVVEDDNINKKNKKKIQYMLDIVDIQDYNYKMKDIEKRKKEMFSNEEKISFLKGVFLGSGYVLNPKDNYHLEMVVNSKQTADLIEKYMNDLGIVAKITTRKTQYVIYLKDGDSISQFLILLGASVSVLNFEQTRVIKEMNNNLNRSINCETGNMSKIIKSSTSQLEDIQFLKRNNMLGMLPQGLQDVCNIRLENADYSLLDIAQKLGISKSGVNNRFKRLNKIVRDIKEGKKHERI